MKRSLLSFAVLACVAVASAVWDTGRAVVHTVCTAASAGWDYLMGRMPIAPSDPAGEPAQRPRVALIQARTFFARQAKRETPRVTQDWRMCPSV